MQFRVSHIAMSCLLCAALAACNKHDLQREPKPQDKEPIVLSAGSIGASTPVTKAVITDGSNKTMNNFDVNTKIFFVMRSEMSSPAAPVGYEDYGYKGPRASIPNLYTVCRGDVDANASAVKFDATNQHYWDDAHARSSILSIWAYAQKGQTWTDCYFQKIVDNEKSNLDAAYEYRYQTGSITYPWDATEVYPAIREWGAMLKGSTAQTAQTVMCQDLLFSNNLTYNSAKSWPDNRLKFNFLTKQFPNPNEMKFYHAMSKITIQIKAGDGFKADGSDFVLGNSTSIDQLAGFNTKGLFNIKDGEFQMIHERTTITSIPKISEKTGKSSDPNYVLAGLAVPNIHEFMSGHGGSDAGSRFVENSADVMIQFTIDGNTYKIKSGALYDALKDLTVGPLTNQIKKCTDNGNYIPMEAGKNYVFTFTVGKERIQNISATLADWVNVEAAEITPSNAYVHLSLKRDEGSAVNASDPQVDLYRAADPTPYNNGDNYDTWAQYGWETGYTASGAKATLSQTSTATVYNAIDASGSEQWYWPNNSTYYHFRTINKGLTVTSGTNDVVSLYSGPVNDTYHATDISTAFADGKFNDYIWGAPFKSTAPATTVYSPAYGFCNNASKADGQLYKGIGSTKDNILLIQHHMMSNIYVDLETTTGEDQVVLAGASVKLVRYAKEAKLQMGNGLVTAYSNYDNGTGTAMTDDVFEGDTNIPAYDYSYRVVPQSMTNASNGEGTKVGMVITASDGNVYIINDMSTIKENSSETRITEWLPGKKYFYKFKLKKTAIEKIEATIVDWGTVTAEEEEVQIQ